MVRKHITTSVPIAGKVLYGLGSWSAYEMARRGEINVIQVGRSDKLAHSPAVALGQNGGVIFWLENLLGTKNNAYFQSFQWQEDRYVLLGSATMIENDKVLPYAPVMLHLDDDNYFMGWMAGDHPNYQAYGRFIAP